MQALGFCKGPCVAAFEIDRSRRRAAVVTFIWVLAALPFLVVSLPPVMDVPNHLARIWLLSGGIDQAPLSEMYEARWSQAATNIFVDVIGTTLARVMSIEAVGQVLLVTMFLAPPLAALWLNKRLFGRLSWWPLAGIAIVWSTTAITGLISYQIALAGALAAAVLVQPFLDRVTPRGLLAITVSTAALLLIHPFGALFFLLLLVGMVIDPSLQTLSRAFLFSTARRIGLVTLACVIPVALLLLLAPTPPGSHGTHQEFMYWQDLDVTLSPKTIGLMLLSPVLSYKAGIDVLMALPVFAVVLWAAVTRRIAVHAGLLIIAGVLELASPFLPMNIGDGGALVIRFPEMAALIALAALRPTFATARQNAVLATVLIVAALVRIGTIGWIWQMRSGDLNQLDTVTATLPAGATVMVLQQRWSEQTGAPLGRLVAGFPGGRCASERHYASLVVMWRQVFIPTLFTVPGQQPLAVTPPYRDKAVFSSGIPFIEDIETPTTQSYDPYLVGWRWRFDYVLLLNADLGRPPLPGTEIVADNGFARLYRVLR
jgi:hypothetical protein